MKAFLRRVTTQRTPGTLFMKFGEKKENGKKAMTEMKGKNKNETKKRRQWERTHERGDVTKPNLPHGAPDRERRG